jgi:hypothetical protein
MSAMNWEGTYIDTIYGGNISVCVTEVSNNNFVGQALFSEVGYMRGPIDALTQMWTGDFWTAGQEVKQGTFLLNLDNNNDVSGWFNERAGNGINYTFTSSKTGFATPDDLACFRTDASLLATPSAPPAYSFTGTFDIGYLTNNFYSSTYNEVYGSYVYFYEDDDNNGEGFAGEVYHDVSTILMYMLCHVSCVVCVCELNMFVRTCFALLIFVIL